MTAPNAATAERWIVLLAHGSQDARWRQPIEALVAQLQARAPGLGVALAYLQFCPPTLEQSLRRCNDLGGISARVVPVFISGGGHLLRDVPQAVERAAASVPKMTVRCSGALGEEPEVLGAMVAATLRLSEDL